jgi:hypothetical protein
MKQRIRTTPRLNPHTVATDGVWSGSLFFKGETMKLTLLKTIPSSSHNAPYSEELGEHWPEGQQFKLLDKTRQRGCQRLYRTKPTSTIVEQIGGEEVLVSVPNDQFQELFGIASPYAV